MGFLRGPLYAAPRPLEQVRREVGAKENLRDYTLPTGPILSDALTAIERAVSFDEFLPTVTHLAALIGETPLGHPGGSVGADQPGLGSRIGELSRSAGGRLLPTRIEHGRRQGWALIEADRARQFAKAMLELARNQAIPVDVRRLLPEEADLPRLGFERIQEIGRRGKTGISGNYTGLLWMAASAAQPPA